MTDEEELNKLLVQAAVTPSHETRELIPYLVNAGELIRREMPPKQMLISTFMASASFGMLVAPRGLGKSWFSLALAVAVATGQTSFLGWKIHKEARVLYIDGEMQTIDLKDRIAALSTGYGLGKLDILPSEELYQSGKPVCLDDKFEQRQIEALLATLKKEGRNPSLIILDNLSTLRRGVDENSNSETQSLVDFLISLRHRGYAVLVVHHTNKAGQQRGASILEVPMDYVIELKKPEGSAIFHKGACFDLKFSKIRGQMPDNHSFTAVLENNASGILQFSVDHSVNEVPDTTSVLRVLAEAKGTMAQRAIGERTGWSNGKVNKLINSLKKEGLVAVDHRGTRITEYGEFELHQFFPDRFDPPPNQERFELPF
jgi:biotin operon repressor